MNLVLTLLRTPKYGMSAHAAGLRPPAEAWRPPATRRRRRPGGYRRRRNPTVRREDVPCRIVGWSSCGEQGIPVTEVAPCCHCCPTWFPNTRAWRITWSRADSWQQRF